MWGMIVVRERMYVYTCDMTHIYMYQDSLGERDRETEMTLSRLMMTRAFFMTLSRLMSPGTHMYMRVMSTCDMTHIYMYQDSLGMSHVPHESFCIRVT